MTITDYTHPTFSVTYNKPTDLIVCDPCYVITHTNPAHDRAWQKMCEEWYPPELRGGPSKSANRGTIRYDGAYILYSSTVHGDGEYHVSDCGYPHSGSIGVDSGLISIITLADAVRLNPSIKDLERIITLVRGFTGTIHATGTGFSGGLTVLTDDDKEEDDDNSY